MPLRDALTFTPYAVRSVVLLIIFFAGRLLSALIVIRISLVVCVLFFFFQAEDGIRDWSVTGVQTCALPILRTAAITALRSTARDAPYRYVHALFHPRADTRVAALGGELPHGVRELAMYLRDRKSVV